MHSMAESKVFCMLPWIGLHIAPNGDIFPCCGFTRDKPVGSLREASLEAIWNSKRLREVRLRMLEGKEVPHCQRCYQLEAAGCPSNRLGVNQEFASHLPRTRDTHKDGSLTHCAPATLEIRFSNRCNFRCRTCRPVNSTAWNDDLARLRKLGNREVLAGEHEAEICTPTAKPEDLLRQIMALSEGLERIYFSGGEPLINPEYYQLLKALIERKRTNVRLDCQTNFSVTALGGQDVFELWKQFSQVDVRASLDALGARGEYIRKNQDWAQVVAERERLLRTCPRARFSLTPTLSVMNALHLPELHRDWIEKGYIAPEAIFINYVLEPDEFRVQILPERLKEEMAERYERHITWLAANGGRAAETAGAQFRAAISFARDKGLSCLLDKFRRTTRALDAIRGERFAAVFPELAELMEDA